MRRTVLIVAGDRSGDRHAARLVSALKTQAPEIEVAALGGGELRRVADRFLGSLVDLETFGFWQPVAHLPALLRLMRSVVDPFLRTHRPQAVIPVDYYGFNIHVAEHAHGHGIPVIYYISPQVWASRPGRIRRLARVVRRMLVIFPFEEALYRQHGVPASFVGHPLLECLPEPALPASGVTDAPADRSVVGLLPGSRRGEIERHLPRMLQAAVGLNARVGGLTIQLFPTAAWDERILNGHRPSNLPLQIICDNPYDHRRRLTVALTCSGTATLENALLGVPMVVMYRLSWLNYWMARTLVRSPFIAMPNILANRCLVPELIQGRASAAALAETAYPFLTDPGYRDTIRRQLLTLRTLLGSPGASRRAAQHILEVIQ